MRRKDVLDVVSAAGVIASLIFVGLEVRQNSEATQAATVLQLKQGWSELNHIMMQNPAMMDALVLVVERGYANVDANTQMVVAGWWRTLLHNWSNAYFQYRAGTLSEEQWAALLRDMETEARYSVVWEVWQDWSHIYDEPFQVLLDSMKAENFDPSAVMPIPGLDLSNRPEGLGVGH